MTAYIFTMYKEGKAVKNVRIFAYDENDAKRRAGRLVIYNPDKYDNWELN